MPETPRTNPTHADPEELPAAVPPPARAGEVDDSEIPPMPASGPMTFGAAAKELGLLSVRDAIDVYKLQAHEEGQGLPRRPLGEICKELGLMTEEQVRQVLEHMKSPIRKPDAE